ncbi:hypothetical protein AB0H42_29290 [Nocardia sp. NPDC050799]|uniref:WXG100 family type VII secretion target n=1 Tax=Nocardia sp. NPDC050799 TaxID=3154842 RepID=UPI0033F833D0
MSEQFRADPDRLRSAAPAFDQIGAEVAALVHRLEELVTTDLAPWGNDDTGRAFGEQFAPEEQQTLSELRILSETVQQTGPDLRQVAANFEQQDLLGSQAVRTAGPPVPTGVNPVQTNYVSPVVGFVSDPSASTAVPAAEVAPTDPGRNETVAGASGLVPTGSSVPGDTGPGRAPAGDPGSAPGGDARASDAQQSRSPEQQQSPGERDLRDGPQTAPTGVPAVLPGAAGQAATAGPPPSAVSRGSANTPADVTRPARAGSANPSGSPWSKTPPGGSPRVTAPGSSASDMPPRMPGRPLQRSSEKPAEPERRPAEEAVEPIAARLARELAERHGVRAFGFDTPGVPREVLMEMVAAVHDVLPRHPAIALAAIGIAELADGAATRLDPEPSDPAPAPDDHPDTGTGHPVCITLAVRAAVEPAALERAVRSDEEAGVLAPGCAQRPVYSAVVRELGRALDVAGGFRARTGTRHALVVTYLPLVSRDAAGSLARTVAGFGQWRAQLSGGFRAGRFDPEAALAEAFTEVVLDVARASPQARALHRLLVDSASAARPRSDPPGDPGR